MPLIIFGGLHNESVFDWSRSWRSRIGIREGHTCFKKADVVLYDYLVHPNIVLTATNAEKVCVGKERGHIPHSKKTLINYWWIMPSRGRL